MDAVYQINVGVAGRAKDNLRTWSDSAGSMCGAVVQAEVSFHFGDEAGTAPGAESFAEQGPGHGNGVPVEKSYGQCSAARQRVD